MYFMSDMDQENCSNESKPYIFDLRTKIKKIIEQIETIVTLKLKLTEIL